MGFKRTQSEKEFVESARGETSLSPKADKKELKNVSVLISLKTIDRIKRFQQTEAKKIETQSYIYENAVNEWLDKRGFEK